MLNHPNIGKLILRVSVSGLMLTHGIPKLMKLLSGDFSFADPIGLGPAISLILAVIGEAICPILIIIGLKTRMAAIPAAITMGVAAFIIHGGDPLAEKEKALLFFFGFVAIAFLGAGSYSVDKS